MKKWKVISIFCVIAIVFTMLGACTKGGAGKEETGETKQAETTEKKKDPVKVVFWYWEDREGQHTDILNDSESWKKSTNNDVIMEAIGWDIYHDKLITSISAGGGPDVYKMQPQWMPELMGLDAVMPLDEYLKDWDVIKEIPESMLAVGRAGQDKLYSLPHMNVVMYLYCRKDMFEEAGVKYPETMDEFYEACKALTKDTNGDGVIDQYGFNLRGARGGHDMWAGLTMNCGVDYLDANGNAAFNTPEMIEANEKYINLYKEGYAPKTAPTDGFKEIIENFKAGVGAMLVHHVASSVDIVETLGDENVAVVPLPKGKGGRYVPMSPASMTVYAKTENKEEAIDYLKWINSYEQHDIICQAVGQVPFIKSVFERPAYMNNRFMAASIESLEEARMAPVVDLMGVWTEKVWPQTIQRALLGEIDSKQMIEQLAAGLQK